ncbi:polyphosphate kinase [Puia dinghuensis]|uniref:Polyphosphate kinase n=2 Tax=Puia dinghuensis TaxID=1792502 RepID=A0A8J2U9V9_9BACT|nr:polyphosphate kinase [Puia dinghuensis]
MQYMAHHSYFDRDLSWLTFNYRVLEEAASEQTPLLERVLFLSIYCSNLDEFYRVRIPAIAALQKIKETRETFISASGVQLLTKISSRLNGQLEHFGQLLTGRVLPALAAKDIHFVYHRPIPATVQNAATSYFLNQVLAFLQPVHLPHAAPDFFPENDHLYFLVILDQDSPAEEVVILNIPSDDLPRFYSTGEGQSRHILFIDDIIRENLSFVFPYATISTAYSFKISRDAELDLEDEYQGDIVEKIEKKLAKRDAGLATRLLYEPGIPLRILQTLIRQLQLEGATVVEGGRYHNLRDLAGFPVKDPALSYTPWPALRRNFDHRPSLLQAIMEKDLLLHVPYESYDPVLRFFNEAAIHPQVEEIYLTLYRVAKDSRIVHALISACRNGKKVTVFVELKARFDEANNIRWAKKMKEAGVKIIYSIPGLKVHAKIGLVKKRVDGRIHYCGLLATGNLNENTARVYTDHILLTGQHDLMRELELLFIFLSTRKDPRKTEKITFQHLLVAQFNLLPKFLSLIDREIAHARDGKPASIIIKMNNLEEKVLIDKLYEASRAGVRIQLIVRSICCCVPGINGEGINTEGKNITIRRIVDRYLEHGRVFIFHNDGQEEFFLGSSDWMNRNIYRRLEVCFPLYEQELKDEIRELIRLQLDDTAAATAITAEGENIAVDALPAEDRATATQPEETLAAAGSAIRSQEAIYQYLAARRGNTSDKT